MYLLTNVSIGNGGGGSGGSPTNPIIPGTGFLGPSGGTFGPIDPGNNPDINCDPLGTCYDGEYFFS